MSLSLKTMSITAAVGIAALSTIAAPTVHAQSGSTYYQVELNEAAKKDEKIIRGVMIRCNETSCRGKKTGSSSVNMCAKIARTFGSVKSFSAGDSVFDEAELTKCNEKAS